jgi:hypothetical protein
MLSAWQNRPISLAKDLERMHELSVSLTISAAEMW